MVSRRILGDPHLLVWFSAILLFGATSQGQVQIKERIAIDPSSGSQNKITSESGEAEVIAPYAGLLKVKVNYVEQIGSAIPSDAYVNIRMHGTDYVIPIASYAGRVDSYSGIAHDFCNLLWDIPVLDDARSFQEGSDSLYHLSGIALGDTLLFSYHGGEVAGGDAMMETDSTWSVNLSLRDPCLHSTVFPHGAFNKIWCWLTMEMDPAVSTHCIAVQISPCELAPGDTAFVMLSEILQEGSTAPFPANTLFDVGISEGSGAGTLMAEADTGKQLFGHHQPFRFIVYDSLATDSVHIKILASENTSAASPMVDATLTTSSGLHPNSDAKNGAKELTRSIHRELDQPLESEACGQPGEGVARSIQLMVLDRPPEQRIQTISGSNPPQMPTPLIKVQLKNFKGRNVNFYWDDSLSWTGRGHQHTPRVPELYQGMSPGSGNEVTDIALDLSGFTIGERKIPVIRGGLSNYLLVSAAAGDKLYRLPQWIHNLFAIKGLNPTPSDVKAEIALRETEFTLALQAIAFHESMHSFHQFGQDSLPLQGGDDPRDIGVMQINQTNSDDLIWDWTKNVAFGASLFRTKKSLARTYSEDLKKGLVSADRKHFRHPLWKEQRLWYWNAENGKPNLYPNVTELTDDQILRETVQLYNGGAYYRWDPSDSATDPEGPGTWIVSPPAAKKAYVPAVMKIYDDVQSGRIPPRWD
jgi:hypothetical protein